MRKNAGSLRKDTISKQLKAVELTNKKSGEVLVFYFFNEIAKYLVSLDLNYKASPIIVLDTAKSIRIYNNLFKIKYIN